MDVKSLQLRWHCDSPAIANSRSAIVFSKRYRHGSIYENFTKMEELYRASHSVVATMDYYLSVHHLQIG